MGKKKDERFAVMLDRATLDLLDKVQAKEVEAGQEPMSYEHMVTGMVRCFDDVNREPIGKKCRGPCVDLVGVNGFRFQYCPACGHKLR